MYIVYASIITVTNSLKKNNIENLVKKSMYKSKKTNRCLTFSVYIHTVHTTYFSHYIGLDEIFGHGISNSGRLGQIFLRTTLLCLRS